MTPIDHAAAFHELEAAIMRKVYPEAVYDEQMESWAFSDGDGGFYWKAIGLEDVIATIKMLPSKEGQLFPWKTIVMTILEKWELGKSLENQTEETKDLIRSILL